MEAVLATSNIIKNTAVVSVYPNPAHDNITVQTTNVTGISQTVLLDMSGKQVMATLIVSGNQSIDISSLPSGMYMLKVTMGNGVKQVIKVTKE